MPASEAPVRLVQDTSGVTIDDLANLYESVGFGRREHYVHVPNLIEKMFCQGVYGFFAYAEKRLVGMTRVFSDDQSCAWIAEICVHPDWQRRGIGHALVDQVNRRFSHTALYCEALNDSVDFLIKMGIKPKAKLVACSRAPLKKN
mgnify:CR=1 FL=1